ncbi:MAG: 2-oxo acid dehydrogenase subunit E2 [Bdellovibrionales bacterium]|nr:2-oxo acid dehydrogenase subunit E2 [Bdellovibrionales bacterium]
MASKDVKLPDIGEGVTEGEMVKWLVKVGDVVKADQPIAEVMTDKATVEVPTPVAGVVKELKVKEGDVVPIETTLLVLDASTSAAAPAPKTTASPAMSAANSSTTVAAHAKSAAMAMSSASGTQQSEAFPPPAAVHVLATPATRRLAREMSVDINVIAGSGLAGRVTLEDVMKSKTGEGAVAAGKPAFTSAPAPRMAYASTDADERVPLRGIRRKIAEQMQMTKQVVPHFTIMDEAKVTELVRLRAQSKEAAEKYGIKVTYLPFVIKALISTMREFPMFNASIDDQAGEIVYKKHFNIGFAADTPNGLLVPVIKNADQKTILEISKEITDLAKKARDGKLSLDEMKGATITITNIGSVGGTYATPIINHPEVAIIGMYKVDWKPVYVDGEFVPTQVMNFTATCDHRLIDGAVAANFLKAFLKRVENVGQLVLDMI